MKEENGFMSHVVEARKRIIRSLLVVSGIFLLLLPFTKDIFNWFSQPLINQLPEGQGLIAINLIDPIIVPLKLDVFLAICISVPYIFYQIWSFIAPGLYQNERKTAWSLLVGSIICFALGLMFAYFVIFPMLFKFFIGYAPSVVTVTPDIDQYLSLCLRFLLLFGFSFQLPIATILLVYTDLIYIEQLKNARPYVIVIIFTIGMLVTPPDVLSQIVFSVPVCLLYELGIVLSHFYTKR